jgi:hypothetical protein
MNYLFQNITLSPYFLVLLFGVHLYLVLLEGSLTNTLSIVRFEILTAVVTNVVIFWDIAPCMWIEVSEECITPIFRVENQPRKKPACSRCLGRILVCQKMSELYFDRQPVSHSSWCQAPIWDTRPIFLSPWNFLEIVASLLFCSALSDERTSL